jgi:hypothetical protein
MFSMWVSGWCAALAISAIQEGRYGAAALDIGLALFNGLVAWANWVNKK